MNKSKIRLDVYGLRLSLSLLKNLISFIYFKITGTTYIGKFSALEKFHYKNYEFSLKKNEILIETISCGFCGSDNKILNYDYSFFSSAFLDTKKTNSKFLYLGHEVYGKILDVGKKVKKFKKGDFVTIDSMNRNFDISKNKFGGWSNYFTKFEEQIIKLDKKIDKNKSVFIEPLACCLQPIKNQNFNEKNVLIIGLGTIGIGIAALIKFFYKDKVKIFAISKNQIDLKKVKNKIFNKIVISNDVISASSKLLNKTVNKKLLNRNLSEGFDFVFDCSGSNKVIDNALRIINQNSKLFLMSMNMKKLNFDPTPIWIKDASIVGIHGYDQFFNNKYNSLKYCENILLSKNFNHKSFTTLDFKFYNWKKFIKSRSRDKLKKVINFK